MPTREAVITILLLFSLTLNLKLNSQIIGGKVKTALGKTKVDDTLGFFFSISLYKICEFKVTTSQNEVSH